MFKGGEGSVAPDMKRFRLLKQLMKCCPNNRSYLLS